MPRKLLSVLASAVAAAGFLSLFGVTAAGAASGGGCQLQGTAAFSPGLSNTAGNFNYSFTGDLTGCQSTVAGSPATGTVAAGQVVTNSAGERFQEPIPTGTGTCANGTTSGTAVITWADGTQSVLRYSTTAAGAAVALTGQVIQSVTLAAINPAPGQPTSLTITTTRYSGYSALAPLAFEADATQCSTPAGVSTAGIAGVATLTSAP